MISADSTPARPEFRYLRTGAGLCQTLEVLRGITHHQGSLLERHHLEVINVDRHASNPFRQPIVGRNESAGSGGSDKEAEIHGCGFNFCPLRTWHQMPPALPFPLALESAAGRGSA